MDENMNEQQPIPQEPQALAPEFEYFRSPFDLKPEEIDLAKSEINGNLKKFEGSGHYWSHIKEKRFKTKLLVDPQTFDSNFILNDNEKQFLEKVSSPKDYSIDTSTVEAMPQLRDKFDLSEEAFNKQIRRRASDADSHAPYSAANLCVLFENKYKVPDEVWTHFREIVKGWRNVGVIAALKMIDPERFQKENLATLVDMDDINKNLASNDAELNLSTRASMKIIQADSIFYDRTHGMQLVMKKVETQNNSSSNQPKV